MLMKKKILFFPQKTRDEKMSRKYEMVEFDYFLAYFS